MRTTTLRDAFAAWRSAHQAGVHLPFARLWDLNGGVPGGATVDEMEHLARCGQCAGELAQLHRATAEAAGWDLAMPQAAAAPGTAPVTLTTACGKFAIAVYPRGGTDEAVITVEVAASHRELLEGAIVSVSDRTGRVLLQAPIVLGRASTRVSGAAGIDTRRLVVRAESVKKGDA